MGMPDSPSFAELRQMFKETDARFKETDAQIRRLEGLFSSQWGRMLEALVKPGILSLFQGWGIQVSRLFERPQARVGGDTMEVDLLLENAGAAVVVEIKSRFSVDDVRDVQADLAAFTRFFPLYRHHRIYGAIAGLDVAENADRYAYKQGLFVLTVSGNDMVRIKNDPRFRPRDYNPPALPADNVEEAG